MERLTLRRRPALSFSPRENALGSYGAQLARDQLQYDCDRFVSRECTGNCPNRCIRLKSEVGREVAKRLVLKFLDADDFHSNANKDKMHRGVVLSDDDRRHLKSLREALRQELDSGTSCVLACSALKRVYREQLCDR